MNPTPKVVTMLRMPAHMRHMSRMRLDRATATAYAKA
ncbi:hypothetical protein J2794_002168 [Paraburkholderia terricola]|nr:hypothetical protein [Paraburkholderia terricola]